jgi:hypothetical protein
MDRNLTRMITTAIIWGVLLLMAVTAMVTHTDLDFWVILLGLAAGTVSTLFIWDDSATVITDSGEKSKRSGRVDRVLKRLNDAELDELRERLLDSDGEMLTLDELLAERERRIRG